MNPMILAIIKTPNERFVFVGNIPRALTVEDNSLSARIQVGEQRKSMTFDKLDDAISAAKSTGLPYQVAAK